jgi:Protein of unknown function (DUF3572)
MRFKQPKPAPLDHAGAEALAAQSLTFLTADPNRLNRFLADSGMDPQQLAASLTTGGTGILAAALDHIVGDESLLLVFASEVRCKPEEIMMAHTILQGPTPLNSM